MRSERSEVKAKGGQDRAPVGLRRGSGRKSALRRLTLEGLEARTLLATLPGSLLVPAQRSLFPAPLVVPNSQTDISGSRGDESSPSIAINKNNPQQMVAVWTRNDPAIGGTTKILVEGVFSTNGGQSWSSLPGIGNALVDPTSTASPRGFYSQITDASVAFDRNNNVYILTSQHQASVGPNAPNALTLSKFSLANNSLNTAFINKVVYQSVQDSALSPVLAVDDNVPLYNSDPDQPGFVQSDRFSGNVYIAWATNDQPQTNATNFNGNRILLTASSDGGSNFSGPVVINDNGNNGSPNQQRATTPQIAISQGNPALGIPGGQVTVIYDDFNSLATANPPRDVIRSVRVSGAAAQSVTNGEVGDIKINPAAPLGVNDFKASVSITNPNFVQLNDLSVSISLTQAQVSDLRIELIAPNGTSIVLSPNGGATPGGAAGANLGVAVSGDISPTLFTDGGVSTRPIGNAASTSPYVGYYLPQGGSFRNRFGGLTPAQINGIWTLRITNNGTAVGSLKNWALNFMSGLTPSASTVVATPTVRGALTSGFPLGAVVTGEGIGPGISIASDNTLGAFSPFQGRLYVAYTDRGTSTFNPADNTDIYLSYSDNGGQTWSFGTRVNDDIAANDGFSEGSSPGSNPNVTRTPTTGRPQFQPQVQVDPTTGTVVMSWLDARNDAARARVATYIAASNDGGASWAPQVYANRSQTAIDAITGKTVVLGPIPDNESSGNPNTDGTFGFGTHQGLAVYGGQIYPIWASNENSVNDLQGLARLDIRMAKVLIASGPRIIDSTMGAVGLSGDTLNPQTPSGSPKVQTFVITFDRPVDPLTVLSNLATIFYVSADGSTKQTIQASQVEFLSSTQYRISFVPQVGVGTYSYLIKPEVRDRIRNPDGVTSGNLMDQNGDAVGGEQLANRLGDFYAAPSPTNPLSIIWDPNSGTFVPGPYDQDTLPLVLAGPRVLTTQVPGSPVSEDNLVLNGTVSAIDVTFDRDMDPNSITPGSVLRIMGPSGQITGPFTFNAVGGSLRTFRIGFPTQTLSGTYTITLASSITSAAGDELDTNLNAGVDVLRQTPTSTTIPQTYPSTGLQNGIAIAPQQTITSTIDIADSYLVQDLTLILNINYPFDPDLEAVLIGPDGTTVKLFTAVGNTGTQANFNNTTFDDTASTQIQNGGPPFFGRFQPQERLSAFETNQTNVRGTWTLQIKNNAPLNSGRTGSFGNWSLSAQKSVQSDGLGELVADQATASFRIYTSAATNPQSHNTWTSVGPASSTDFSGNSLYNGYAGQIGAIAVDPSDTSGNTVYVAGSSGGIWKTTNFLTTSSQGPTYIPLTDFGPTTGLNIGSITVFPRNNDTNQSIIIAGTGFADTRPGNGNTIGGNTSRGVGFLRSMDGGATWTLLDSTNNNLPFSGTPGSPSQRDHLFALAGASGQGTSTYKVIVDPKPSVDNQVIVYAALAGANGGLWRSIDTGQTWQKLSVDSVQGTTATDISFDLNSAIPDAVNNPTGNVNVLNVAFQGSGVYISPNRGQTLNLMAGNNFVPSIRDGNLTNPPAIIAPAGTFPTNPGRIVLARPDPVSSNPRDPQNVLYEGWLYAAVASADGNGLLGLYLTKDNGTTWTKLQTNYAPVNNLRVAVPSNSTARPAYDPTTGRGLPDSSNYTISLAIDQSNPNIVYLGGTSLAEDSGLIRVDSSKAFDSHASVIYDGSQPDGGLLQIRTAGRTQVKVVTDGTPVLSSIRNGTISSTRTQYLNLLTDPNNQFDRNTTLYLTNVTQFTNNGAGVTWTPFDRLLARNEEQSTDPFAFTTIPATNIHRVISMVDPLTGHTRPIFGTDQGVFTGVDDNGSISLGIGSQDAPTYSRNGNLAISQFYYGAAQPSNLAANAAQALIYGNGLHTYVSASDPNVLNNGDLAWYAPNNGEWDGVGVQADQQGRGIVYQYSYPGFGGYTDFFQVSSNGGPYVSRTNGLIQTGGSVDPQWPGGITYGQTGLSLGNFAINPINGDQVIISSAAGRVFATINQGLNWLVIAEPTALDGSYAPALTFGAPDPASPGGIGSLNNFVYAGTVNGHIFVTQTGGGTVGGGNAWTDISTGLDGTSVLKIITNPTRGSHEAYAITEQGIYHTENSLATSGTIPVWQNITSNLLLTTQAAFGNASLTDLKTRYLTSIVADWRYVIPNNPSQQNSPTHPVLYVSGDSGVYRSLDDGSTWSLYPNISIDDAPADGGMLPNVHVTDLNMAIGVIDPTTGRAVAQAGDPNDLFATTFGRGTFAIRLAPIVFPNTTAQPNNISLDPSISAGNNSSGIPQVSPLTARPIINGYSEQTAFGNTVLITLFDLTDPANPRIIGGYDPSVPSSNNSSNMTDAFGKYSIQVNQAAFNANGTKTVGIQATDGSGTTGNVAKFVFILQANNLGLPNPPLTPTIGLSPFDDSSNGQLVTNVTLPHILGITDANVTVQLYASLGNVPVGVPLVTGTSDSTGNFSLQFQTPLTDGDYFVQVRATNTFGMTDSNVVKFTIDTHGPTTAPTLGILPADDTGIIGDGITSNRRPRFVGTTEPNAIVVIYSTDNLTVPLGQANADAAGQYSIQLPSDLRNGKITVVSRARDIAGNQGPVGSSFPVTITTVNGDYNGDGKADLSLVFRASQSQWLIQNVTGGTPFGTGTLDVPIQGDFDGDGKADLAYYRPSTAQWFVQGIFGGVQYGQSFVDIPVPADYAGTGVTTLATYRPTTGEWFIPNSTAPMPHFGSPGDIPVPGDYDGVGRAQIAVYRPSTGQFFINGHAQPIQVGAPGQIPVPGAYDNTVSTRKVEPAVYNPTTGVMTILGPNNQVRTIQFTPGSIPVPGDYDGVGMDEPASFDPTTSTWTIYAPGSNQPRTTTFGGPKGGGVAVAAPYSYRKLPVVGDYSGVGQAQDSLFRRSTPQGQFFIGGVTGPNGIAFGNGSTDIPIVGDFNGDGRADVAVYRPSTARWYVQGVLPSDGVGFGYANVDLPAPADYYGIGSTQLATFRPTTGEWFVAGTGTPFKLGRQGDTPVPADYDGDGKADIAVFEPANGSTPTRWLVLGSQIGLQTYVYGGSKDVPVPGDYDGTGRAQIATFRPGSAQWFIAGHPQPIQFGGSADIPVPADYNGDGKIDLAVYRQKTGQLFIAGLAQPITFGGTKDIPLNAPLLYRTLSNKISATSTLDFGVKAAALSTVVTPSVAAAATVAAPSQPTASAPPAVSSLTSPVVYQTPRRPNQDNAHAKAVKAPVNRLRAAQLHDSALSSILGRIGKRHS